MKKSGIVTTPYSCPHCKRHLLEIDRLEDILTKYQSLIIRMIDLVLVIEYWIKEEQPKKLTRKKKSRG